MYRAKHVILAVPLGVIQNKSISITPSLGELKVMLISFQFIHIKKINTWLLIILIIWCFNILNKPYFKLDAILF